MDFELRFPDGLEHLNRMVSTSGMTSGDAAVVTHDNGMDYEHLMEWVAFHQKERERELREALESEDYERAVELRDQYKKK